MTGRPSVSILHCSVASGLVDGAIGPVDEPIPPALHALVRYMSICGDLPRG